VFQILRGRPVLKDYVLIALGLRRNDSDNR
jgi:hypothetical protein